MAEQDADRILKDVGRKIAEFRAQAGLTQEQFAERLGMAPSNFQRIEMGLQNLTVRTLARLAGQLDVSVAHLFRPPRSRQVRTGRPPKRAATPKRA